MIEGSDRLEFDNVEVIGPAGIVLVCRVRSRIVGVPPRRMMPGTTVAHMGDRGRLVLSRQAAVDLGLV